MSKKKEEKKSVLFGKAAKETCYFLTILFCALRACGIVNWNWFWVMSPIFFSWIIVFVSFAIVGITALVAIEKGETE